MKFKDGVLSEKIIETNKSEWFLNAICTKRGSYTVYSVFRGVYGDLNRYIKLTTLDKNLENLKTKIIPLTDLSVGDISFDSSILNGKIWVLAKKEKQLYYMQFDSRGNHSGKIDLVNIGKKSSPFVILKKKQIQVVNRSLKVTEEEVVSIGK